ncbi:prealbumin-like fold domain-containing protein [Bacillus sp. SL00103]
MVKLLAGVTFDLIDANDQRIKKDLKTDKNGQLTVDQLKPGTYQFAYRNSKHRRL